MNPSFFNKIKAFLMIFLMISFVFAINITEISANEQQELAEQEEFPGCLEKEFVVENQYQVTLPSCGPNYCESTGGEAGFSCSCEEFEDSLTCKNEFWECPDGLIQETCELELTQDVDLGVLLVETEEGKLQDFYFVKKEDKDFIVEGRGITLSEGILDYAYFVEEENEQPYFYLFEFKEQEIIGKRYNLVLDSSVKAELVFQEPVSFDFDDFYFEKIFNHENKILHNYTIGDEEIEKGFLFLLSYRNGDYVKKIVSLDWNSSSVKQSEDFLLLTDKEEDLIHDYTFYFEGFSLELKNNELSVFESLQFLQKDFNIITSLSFNNDHPSLEQYANFIAEWEGFRESAYRLGNDPFLHIGFGTYMDRKYYLPQRFQNLGLDMEKLKLGEQNITREQARKMLIWELEGNIESAKQLLQNFDELPFDAKLIVVDMIYNLGHHGFQGFVRTRAALENFDFETAADEMVDSRWFDQVGRRSKHHVDVMRGLANSEGQEFFERDTRPLLQNSLSVNDLDYLINKEEDHLTISRSFTKRPALLSGTFDNFEKELLVFPFLGSGPNIFEQDYVSFPNTINYLDFMIFVEGDNPQENNICSYFEGIEIIHSSFEVKKENITLSLNKLNQDCVFRVYDLNSFKKSIEEPEHFQINMVLKSEEKYYKFENEVEIYFSDAGTQRISKQTYVVFEDKNEKLENSIQKPYSLLQTKKIRETSSKEVTSCVDEQNLCEDQCILKGGFWYDQESVGSSCELRGVSNLGISNPSKGLVCCQDVSTIDMCGGINQPPCSFGCNQDLSACNSASGEGICLEKCSKGDLSFRQVSIEDGKFVSGDDYLVLRDTPVRQAQIHDSLRTQAPNEISISAIEVILESSNLLIDATRQEEVEFDVNVSFKDLQYNEDILIVLYLANKNNFEEVRLIEIISIPPVGFGDEIGYMQIVGNEYEDNIITIPLQVTLDTLITGEFKFGVSASQESSEDVSRFWKDESSSEGIIYIFDDLEDVSLPVLDFGSEEFSEQEIINALKTLIDKKNKFDKGQISLEEFYEFIVAYYAKVLPEIVVVDESVSKAAVVQEFMNIYEELLMQSNFVIIASAIEKAEHFAKMWYPRTDNPRGLYTATVSWVRRAVASTSAIGAINRLLGSSSPQKLSYEYEQDAIFIHSTLTHLASSRLVDLANGKTFNKASSIDLSNTHEVFTEIKDTHEVVKDSSTYLWQVYHNFCRGLHNPQDYNRDQMSYFERRRFVANDPGDVSVGRFASATVSSLGRFLPQPNKVDACVFLHLQLIDMNHMGSNIFENPNHRSFYNNLKSNLDGNSPYLRMAHSSLIAASAFIWTGTFATMTFGGIGLLARFSGTLSTTSRLASIGSRSAIGLGIAATGYDFYRIGSICMSENFEDPTLTEHQRQAKESLMFVSDCAEEVAVAVIAYGTAGIPSFLAYRSFSKQLANKVPSSISRSANKKELISNAKITPNRRVISDTPVQRRNAINRAKEKLGPDLSSRLSNRELIVYDRNNGVVSKKSNDLFMQNSDAPDNLVSKYDEVIKTLPTTKSSTAPIGTSSRITKYLNDFKQSIRGMFNSWRTNPSESLSNNIQGRTAIGSTTTSKATVSATKKETPVFSVGRGKAVGKADDVIDGIPGGMDATFVNPSKRVFGVADGVSHSGRAGGVVARQGIKKIAGEFDIIVMRHHGKPDASELIRVDMTNYLNRLGSNPTGNTEFVNAIEAGGTSTFVVSKLTPDNKLYTFRLGDTEARVLRGNRLFELDDLVDQSGALARDFNIETLPSISSSGPRFQVQKFVVGDNVGSAPNQFPSLNEHRITIHQLQPNDRVILSSDGISKLQVAKQDNWWINLARGKPANKIEDDIMRSAIAESRGSLPDDFSIVAMVVGDPTPPRNVPVPARPVASTTNRDQLDALSYSTLRDNQGFGTASEILALNHGYRAQGPYWLLNRHMRDYKPFSVNLRDGSTANFKLHITSTQNNFDDVLLEFGPFLDSRRISAKVAPGKEIFENHDQYGKVFTIYPKDVNEMNIVINKAKELRGRGLQGLRSNDIRNMDYEVNLRYEREVPGTDGLVFYTIESHNGIVLNNYPQRQVLMREYFGDGPLDNLFSGPP